MLANCFPGKTGARWPSPAAVAGGHNAAFTRLRKMTVARDVLADLNGDAAARAAMAWQLLRLLWRIA